MSSSRPISASPAPLAKPSIALLALAAVLAAAPDLRAAESMESTVDPVLRGQARFLAMAANQALDEWRPDEAMLVALNALPGAYGGDRPVVPDAQMALNRAVHESGRIKRTEVEDDPLFAVISPDGSHVAVVPEDAEAIEVFEVATGERVLLAEHDEATIHAAFAGDGRLLATLGDDGLRLWDLSDRTQAAYYDWREQETATQNAGEIEADQSLSSVFESLSMQSVDLPKLGGRGSRDPQLPLIAFSPDATMVAYASDRGGLELRRISDGELLHLVELEPELLYFEEDGSRVMVLDRDKGEFVGVDVNTGNAESLAEDVIIARALSGADGIKMSGVENGHLILFNAMGERTTEIKTPSLWPAGDDDGDPRGSLRKSTLIVSGPGMVAGGTRAGVLVWDPEKTTQMEHFRGGDITSLAVSNDGEFLVAGQKSGAVRLWDTDAFGSLWIEAESWEMPGHEARVVFVGFAGDDGDTAVSLAVDRSLTFRKLPARKTELEDWGWGRNPVALLSRDGRWVSKYDDRLNTLDVWDTRTGEKRSSVNRTAQPLSRNSFHPEDAQVLVSSPFSRVLDEEQPAAELLDLDSDDPASTTEAATKGRPAGVDRSIYVMEGRRIVTAATERKPSFSVWNARNGRLLRNVEGEQLLAGSWQGSRLVTLSGWDLVLHDLSDDTSVTVDPSKIDIDREDLAAEFDDAGSRLLIRSGAELTLWDTATNEIIDSLSATEAPTHFGISPDGSRFFVVDEGVLTIRQDGGNVDQLEVEERNLLFALINDRIVTVTWGGSLIELSVPKQVSVEEAIAQLPAEQTCLTPEQREAYDLPVLSADQWDQRGCSQFGR